MRTISHERAQEIARVWDSGWRSAPMHELANQGTISRPALLLEQIKQDRAYAARNIGISGFRYTKKHLTDLDKLARYVWKETSRASH